MNILNLLGKKILFFDGAMGTLLQARGLKPGELPEIWNHTRPADIQAIHEEYLEAGADILITNTFGANSLKLKDTGYSLSGTVQAAVRHARKAIGSQKAFCALDLGPTGKLLRPLGDIPFEDAYQLYKEIVLAGEGADLILIETMNDTYELKAAILAAKENSSLPVFATAVFDQNNRMLTGSDPRGFAALLEGLGVDALGANCSLGPKQMLPLIEELATHTSIPLIASPNAGMPCSIDGRPSYDTAPEEFAALMQQIAHKGPWVLGGCCGTTPEYIRLLKNCCKNIRPLPLKPKNSTIVSSYARSICLGEAPVIIGERINPTGKPRLKEALLENKLSYILTEGFAQAEAGAHILDVNVGLPGVDEASLLTQSVCSLQAAIDLPLQIDTSNIEAMEKALRLYNGKALVNSVNAKTSSLETILPLVKKYGGVLIGLALGEEGIPPDAQGRLEAARIIKEAALSYGIPAKDLLIDPLCLTVSAEPLSPRVGLESLRLIKSNLGLKTVMGLSNVSFGLPARGHINAAYAAMAFQNGLDAAILNPLNPEMMGAYRASLALLGFDEACLSYTACYTGQKSPPKTDVSLSLEESILAGLKEPALLAAAKELKTSPPLGIISQVMIPALDKIGRGFETGKVFLPQLLMSAEAAKSAFSLINAVLKKEGSPQKKGKIILATVEGDIHDIGKNIVKVLLDNYGYEVIDLGKDVPAQTIADCALQQDVRLIGLSALMTTTVANMEKTISLLKKIKPDSRIMAGGAVLTAEYARRIGAHFYAKDAMAGVDIAKQALP